MHKKFSQRLQLDKKCMWNISFTTTEAPLRLLKNFICVHVRKILTLLQRLVERRCVLIPQRFLGKVCSPVAPCTDPERFASHTSPSMQGHKRTSILTDTHVTTLHMQYQCQCVPVHFCKNQKSFHLTFSIFRTFTLFKFPLLIHAFKFFSWLFCRLYVY